MDGKELSLRERLWLGNKLIIDLTFLNPNHMKKLLNLKSYLLLVILLFTQSCFISKSVARSKARKTFTVENNAIPPDFGKEPTTLLVILRESKGYNRWAKKAVRKKYFGEYVFITRADLEKEEYKDTTKYRYLFDYAAGSTGSSYGYTSTGVRYETTLVFKKYYVYDLKTGKTYKSGAEFTNYGEAMKAYFENLEAIRKANSQ